jgi:hypothetical protein
MTTRQFTSFIAALSIWILMMYYWWLDHSPFAIPSMQLSPAWYWWMLFLGFVPLLLLMIADARQR